MRRNEKIAAALVIAALLAWHFAKASCACTKYRALTRDIPQAAKVRANVLLPQIEELKATGAPPTPRNSRIEDWTADDGRWLIFIKEIHNDGPDGPRPFDHPGVTVYECTEC